LLKWRELTIDSTDASWERRTSFESAVMRSFSLFASRRGLALCGLCAAAVAFAVAPAAGAKKVDVFPPGSSPFGKTYGQWSAEWWQQAVRETGAPGTPFAAGPVNCAALGTGDVVFLVGTTSTSPIARSCSLSKHKAILLPAINAECSQAEDNGSTGAELRACAASLADTFTNVHVVVDGSALRALTRFRFASPLYRFSPVAGNVFGIPEAVGSLSVADGYWVMLHKLKNGTHTVSFGGEAPALGFSTETTYTLTVR
jgi:hypothetical protein